MGSKNPTPASFKRKAHLIWLAFVDPRKFKEEEDADNRILNQNGQSPEVARLDKIRTALWESSLWCLGSVFAGVFVGGMAWLLLGPRSNAAVFVIAVGTVIVLWATLAVRGWDIQSWDDVTLSERLNRWVFRSLYSLGTALMVAGSFWSVLPTQGTD